MKILELAPYVFIENHPSAARKQTGLAYMVRSICDMLASQGHDVHVLTQAVITQKMTVGKWEMVKREYATIFSHFKWRYLRLAIKNFFKYRDLGIARTLLYWLSAGQVEDYIKEWHPDVIHVHGTGSISLPFYYAAARQKVPTVSTLHGLYSFNTLFPKPQAEINIERLFLKMCVSNGYSMTFISSGMKRIVSDYCTSDCPNIRVIPNCYRPTPVTPRLKKCNRNGEIHLTCVGTLTTWKNQIQVIRILPKLRNEMRHKGRIVLDLFGDGDKRLEWEKYCTENHIEDVIYHGRVSQAEIFDALCGTDLLVFPSIVEGFGIPIIEAYSCGTPVVTYPDLDASKDLASEDCIVFTKDRSDKAMTEAVLQALNKTWDKEKIIAFSKQFTMDAIAVQYSDEIQKTHKRWNLDDVKRVIENY